MGTRLKCLLLDDELPGLAYLKMLCEQLPQLEVIKAFNSPRAFLKEVHDLEFDLCILDIEMPEMNGLQLSNLLKNKPVIFATAYDEYAAEAFDLNAIDYIRKPIRMERLQQAVEKAIQFLGRTAPPVSKSFAEVNSDKGKAVLFFDKIAYIKTSETDSRDKVVLFFDGEDLVLKNISFEKLSELLPADEFCRINKKEILSLRAVKVFTYSEITTSIRLESGKNLKLPLNETYRTDFLRKIRI